MKLCQSEMSLYHQFAKSEFDVQKSIQQHWLWSAVNRTTNTELTWLWVFTVTMHSALTRPPKFISPKQRSEATEQVTQNPIPC